MFLHYSWCMKRGQVTLFIMVGIMLVAIAFLLVFYKEQLSEQLVKAGIIKKGALEVEAGKVKLAIEGCLEELTGDAVLHVAANGGYVLEPEGDAAFYARDSQLTAPALEQVEGSVSDYIDRMIPFCIFGEAFDAQVEQSGNAQSTVKILEDKVEVTVDYPAMIVREGSSMTINGFTAEINARLGLLHKIAVEVADQHKGKAGTCFSCLFQRSIENDLKMDVYSPEETADVYFIVEDKKVLVNNKPLVYTFAMQLGGIE